MTIHEATAFPVDDAETAEERCPACGDPIDYCQGHGEIGDPEGFAALELHDLGNHSRCHTDSCEYAPAPSPFSYDGERRARAIFRRVFGDEPSFMTPDLVKLETIGDCIVEVSERSGLEPGTRLYGVTVLELDGTLLATLEGHTDSVESAVFSPDGTRIVTASRDDTSRLWVSWS